jgi:hypothetical protein
MPTVPMKERLGRGGLNDIRERLLANEAVDFSQELGLTQIRAKVDEMEVGNANGDPGDLASLFLNQLI